MTAYAASAHAAPLSNHTLIPARRVCSLTYAAAFSKGTALSHLESLGYSRPLARAVRRSRGGLAAEHAETDPPESFQPARVVRADRGSVLVATEDDVVRAEPSARLRQSPRPPTDTPAVGDWVVLRTPPGHDVALVEAVLDRTSAFTRGDSGASRRRAGARRQPRLRVRRASGPIPTCAASSASSR